MKLFGSNGSKRITNIVTGDESWFYYHSVPGKVTNMVCLSKNEPPPKILHQNFCSRKRLFTVFLDYEGPLLVDVLPEGSTMTGQYYCENILKPLFKIINEKKPGVGTKKVEILHDNARPYKTALVQEILDENKVNVVLHPPYSPDLAPCDFWLFAKIKNGLAGQQFSRIQDLARTVNSELKRIPSSEYGNTFDKWI